MLIDEIKKKITIENSLLLLLLNMPLIICAQTNTFPASGNVGIGTTSPNSKLTVKGHVNIGENGNYHLRVRHVDGKKTNSTDLDDLFLNYGTGKHVRIGFGTTNPYSNLYVSGKVGIGTNAPTVQLQVNANNSTHALFKGSYSGIQGIQVERVSGDYVRLVTNYSGYGSGLESSSKLRFSVGGNNIDSPAAVLDESGNLGIGTTTPDSKLSVNGKIHAKEVKVDIIGWPDYIFKEDHDLPTLEEVEQHIKDKGHLINVPSAKEVEENGVELGKMNKLLLEKIEELTLYVLEQQRELRKKDKRMKEIEGKYAVQEKRLQKIEELLNQAK